MALENEFDFDPAPILGKIEAMTDAFETLFESMDSGRGEEAIIDIDNSIESASESVDSFTSNGEISLKKIVAAVGLVGGAFLAIKGAFESMPAVQDTFFQLGEIIKFNFLAPIMQELLPGLNSILAWAHENRAVFTEIGAAIGNGIQIAIDILRVFGEILFDLFNRVSETISDVFGTTTGGITDMFRLLVTQITAGVGLLMIALDPVIDAVMSIFTFLTKGFKSFFEGFSAGFGEFGPMFGDMVETIMSLFEAISNLFSKLSEIELLMDIFRAAGVVAGFVLRTLFGNAKAVIDGVTFAINWVAGKLSEFMDDINRLWERLKSTVSDFFGGGETREPVGPPVRRGPAPSPQSAVPPVLSPTNNNSSKEINVNVSVPMNINQNVTGQNAQGVADEVAQKTSSNVMDQLNRMLNRDAEAFGY